MSISLVGTFEGETSDGSAVTIALSGTASGDVVYGFQQTQFETGTPPTGFTQLVAVSDEFSVSTFYVYRKVLSAAAANVVFAANGGTGNACTVIVLRAVDQATPEDATTTTTFGNNSAPDSPSITTANANAWVITAIGSTLGGTGILAPGDYSNQIEITSGGNESTSGAATKEIASPGAVNPGAWDTSVTLWVAASIAVRAATSGDSGGLFASGTATGAFVARWAARAALSDAGAATVHFLASGGAQGAMAASGAATALFMGDSRGGTTPELSGLVLGGIRKTPVTFRSP